MRGKDRRETDTEVVDRITPAYAGKRLQGLGPSRSTQDHPRVCGEKCNVKKSSINAPGSPPRMRGKVHVVAVFCSVYGITPAYAGKRPSYYGESSAYRDHPRVCGEKFAILATRSSFVGSPPRMRGKAGVRTKLLKYLKDHPRVCGEKEEPCDGFCSYKGSPPRMRGKGSSERADSLSKRITPAYAGKSGMSTLMDRKIKDHPRVCGEKTKKIP